MVDELVSSTNSTRTGAPTPYSIARHYAPSAMFTANHCIDDESDPAASKGNPAAAAASINTCWFFQAEKRGIDTASDVSFVMLPGGRSCSDAA